MNLTIRLLGTEVLHISTDRDEIQDDIGYDLSGGSTTSYPVGFTASEGDQRWLQSPELE